MWCHCTLHSLDVCGDNIELINWCAPCRMVHACSLPSVLDCWEDQHIEWLAFMCHLRWKAEQDHLKIFLIKELIKHVLEFVLFVGFMAIQSEDNWNGIVDVVCPCKWDKDCSNPGDTVCQISPSWYWCVKAWITVSKLQQRHNCSANAYLPHWLLPSPHKSGREPSWRQKEGGTTSPAAETHSMTVTSSRLLLWIWYFCFLCFRKRYFLPEFFWPPPIWMPFSSIFQMCWGGIPPGKWAWRRFNWSK